VHDGSEQVVLRLACVSMLLVAACSGKEGKPIESSPSGSSGSSGGASAPASGDPFEKALVELDGFKTRMCACTDVLCTDKVFGEFQSYRTEMRKTIAASGGKPSKDQDQRGNALDREMRACRSKVAASVRGGSGSGSSADPIEGALVELDGFKAKMCACTDKACADKVQADVAAWKRNLRAKIREKPNALQEMKGNAIDKEIDACRKKAETATPGAPGGTQKIDNMLTQMQSFRDKLCACTTKDCGDKVGKEMEAWQQQAGKDLADAKPTKDQEDKADRLQAEMKTCTTRLK